MDGYTPEDLAKAKLYRDVTPNGVAFDWWLAGPTAQASRCSKSLTTRPRTSTTQSATCVPSATW
jgi:hypothetical protein